MERLTRATLLLTKATFLFLPVSLVLSYFSIQFQRVQYTAAEVWACFIGVLAVSCMALLIFGLYSGTVKTSAFWRSISWWTRKWACCVDGWRQRAKRA